MAILGPSGAGKSSLLDVLAMRKANHDTQGELYFNGSRLQSRSALQAIASYVQQVEAFHPTQTVLEAILFQAHIRLGPSVSKLEKISEAKGLLDKAGLEGKESRLIGGLLPGGLSIGGLSGGEKRRLALCCSMIVKPRLLFVDEPTSGLDSLAALMIMRLLHTFCTSQGLMVVCNIHVTILAKGYPLYVGSPECAERWFNEDLGLAKPKDTSAVDFIMDSCNIDFNRTTMLADQGGCLETMDDLEGVAKRFRRTDPDSFNPAKISTPTTEQARIPDLEAALTSTTADSIAGTKKDNGNCLTLATTHPPSWWYVYRTLVSRNGKNYIRNLGNAGARSALVLFLALCIGTINYQSAAHADIFSILNGAFFSVYCVCLLPFCSQSCFLYDRSFFLAENAGNLYPASAYYFANLTVETLLNAMNGCLFGFIIYMMMGYNALLLPSNPTTKLLGYVGILSLANLLANGMVVCAALLSPNLEIAFLSAAAYLATSSMLGGIASFRLFSRVIGPLQYTSMIKYLYQAVAIWLFDHDSNCHLPLDKIIRDRGLTEPATVEANILLSLVIYAIFTVLGILGLRFLYRDR